MKTSDSIKENERLLALYRHQILDTDSERMFDRITEFAAMLCETPIALISFVDDDRLWIKSGIGLDKRELPKNHSFCSYTIEKNELFEVSDALKDKRFKHTPQVEKQKVRFYAGVPLFDTEGHALGTLSVIDTKIRKLSSKQKAGLKLFADQVSDMLVVQKAKIRFETLIESSQDMIYELDEGGKFLFANKSTIAKTGHSLDQLKKMTCWDIIEEDIRDDVRRFYMNQIKEGKTSIYNEFPIKNADGNTTWLGQSVDYGFKNGRISNIYVIAKDVTELVQTRQMLKESEELVMAEKNTLNMMVFSSPAAIAMFNKDFKYLAFSEKWSLDQEINEKVIGLNTDTKSKLLASIKEKMLKGETIGKNNTLTLTENGDERWFKWVATPWNNTTDGSVGGVIVYTDDITYVKKHEAELEAARKEAVKSSQIKEDFLSSMSHEIRTPLNAIIGTTNLLMLEDPTLIENEKFKLLKFSSNNLLALINNVLDFSKIESGNIKIANKDFELVSLARNLINSWKSVADQKGISLMLSCHEDIPNVVKGDSVRLSQVLNNLVNNALKFTEEGFVNLTIKPDPQNSLKIYFEIRDTGIGIPEKNQKEVFASFKQVESHLTDQEGGTGLGLPICQKLIGMMGSKLKLVSQEGFGSKFSFSLKLENGNPANIPKLSHDKNRKLLNINVLLVEDNKANQFVAKSFLEKWGAKVNIVSNGSVALDYIKDMSYDIVLLDLRMPVMDGYTCAKLIREMEGKYFQYVPIVALTASTILDVKKQGSTNMFTDFLSKPLVPQELYGLLVKYTTKPATSLAVY